MTRSRRPAALVALLAAALTLAACSTATTDEPTPEVGETLPAVPAGLAAYYDQELVWADCGDGMDCTDVSVPLDYDDPDAAEITLAVQRLAADGEAVGSLLINPGGPGSPATDLLAAAPAMFGQDLLAAYDVVAVDPRGVGASTPVDCVDDAELDVILSGQDAPDPAAGGLAQDEADAAALAAACAENTGPLIDEVDTVSAARDMDVIRHLLGEARLDYLGFSYGTYLGAVYAETFPDRVGRLVLDGAMDPTLDLHETTLAQAVGFEEALRAYVTDCLDGPECPLSGSVDDGVGQVATLLEVTDDTPLPTADGRELTQALAFTGISFPLYEDSIWPVLTQALAQAIGDGDGSTLLYLADLYTGRAEDGSYTTNTMEANWAINCLDFGSSGDPETWNAEAAELAEVAPTFGDLFAYGGLLCAQWPGDPVGNRGEPITAAGAGPIMVIGTTGDPATPYEWSVALADQLESGFLVTYEGEGHTAYGRSNACVTQAVDAFLVDGTVPEEGLTC